MIHFEPGVAPGERRAVLDAVESLRRGDVAGLEVRSERLLRCVVRLRLPGGRGTFLKLHRLPRTKDRLRYLLRPLPSVAERAALELVARAAIPCPEPLGHGGLRRLLVPSEAWLATYEVPGAPAAADSLVDALELVSLLAAAGLHHPDLHPGNLLRGTDGRLFLLDLQSVRAALQRDGALAAMRARCCLGFAILRGTSVESVVAEGVGGGKIPAGESRRVVDLALASHGRWLVSRARRNLVESTSFKVSGVLRRRAAARGFEPSPGARRLGQGTVAGLECEAYATSDPAVIAVAGPLALMEAWTGDLWRSLTTGAAPALLACERTLLTGKTRLYVRATNDEWPEILEKDLASCSGLRLFERELRRSKDLSSLVTPVLRAGYNPRP